MLVARLATLLVLLSGAGDSRVSSAGAPRLLRLEAVQDCATPLGIGDDQGTRPGRFEFDAGVPTFTVSGFVFEHEGSSALAKDFGGNLRFSAGANVDTDFELANAKDSLAFDIALGSVTSFPSLAPDYFDFSFDATHATGVASEVVEPEAPVPIDVLRAAAGFGIPSGLAEVGYVDVIDEVEAQFVDIDAMLTVHATEGLDLWVGCRRLALDGDSLIDSDTLLPDITIEGVMLGGGFRF